MTELDCHECGVWSQDGEWREEMREYPEGLRMNESDVMAPLSTCKVKTYPACGFEYSALTRAIYRRETTQ